MRYAILSRQTVSAAMRCQCGQQMRPGLRFGPTPEPVPVLVCWAGCGREDPPLLTSVITCRWGHVRATYDRINKRGQIYCSACGVDYAARRRTA